jgi:hypothetical protein
MSKTSRTRVWRAIAVGGALGVAIPFVRGRYLHWGATDDEVGMALPGDQVVARADVTATRAVDIAAPPTSVWPWIAQLGQGRGGFYSYDFLENLVGCHMRSAERVVPDLQALAVGGEVRLHPEVSLRVVELEPGKALVLRGSVPMGPVPPPYDFTWAFVVREMEDGSTRLLVRERYAYTRRWSALLVEPVQILSFVMSQRMLRGIRARALRGVAWNPESDSQLSDNG